MTPFNQNRDLFNTKQTIVAAHKNYVLCLTQINTQTKAKTKGNTRAKLIGLWLASGSLREIRLWRGTGQSELLQLKQTINAHGDRLVFEIKVR